MRRPTLAQIVIATAGVVLLLAAAWVALRPAASPPVPEDVAEVPRLSVDEARAALDTGQAVFIDVRDAGSYAAGHIPGSLSIPLADIGSDLPQVEPSTWIITYCT